MNRPNKETFYSQFYPISDLDKDLDKKENSLYYSLLVKQYGQDKADYIWDQRLKNDFSIDSLWKEVKNYKPKDKINLIGDLNWGFNSILNNERD